MAAISLGDIIPPVFSKGVLCIFEECNMKDIAFLHPLGPQGPFRLNTTLTVCVQPQFFQLQAYSIARIFLCRSIDVLGVHILFR